MEIGSPDYSPVFGAFPLALILTYELGLGLAMHRSSGLLLQFRNHIQPVEGSGGVLLLPVTPIPQGRRLWEGKGGFTHPGLAQTASVPPVLGVLVPGERLAAARCPPGCAAGPGRAVPAAPAVPVSPFPRSPVRGTIELGMNRLLVYY